MEFYQATSFFSLFSSLLLVCLFFTKFITSGAHGVNKNSSSPQFALSLYKDSDPVLQLNAENFDDRLLNKSAGPVAHLVEFYMSWCGHCRSFAPTWVKFAEDTKNWHNVVKVSAINCAPDTNKPVCIQNDVGGVPHIKYFPANAKSYSDAVEIQHRTIYELRHKLIDLLLDEQQRGRASNFRNVYNTWPNFNPLADTNSIEELWHFLPASQNGDYKYLALIFEHDNDNYTGIEAMLDVSNIKWLKARRVKSSNPLAESLQIMEYPTLVLYARNSKEPLYKSEVRRFLSDKVNSILGLPIFLTTLPSYLTTPFVPTTTLSPLELKSKFYVSETDLLLAMRYALYTEVSSRPEGISGEALEALTNFLDTLRKYFPPLSPVLQETLRNFQVSVPKRLDRSENATKLFTALHSYLISKNNENVSANEWKKLFEELEEKYNYPFPTDQNWQHCLGSDPRYRGYTCGVWMTFHVLTVNAFFDDGFQPNFDPLKILQSFKGYIENFFSCTECAKHFVQMVTKDFPMAKEANKSSDVVLYLWRAHNIVNKRLKGDETEDPQMPKRQFPAHFLCSQCKNGENDWRQTAVLHYMTHFYVDIRPSSANNSENRRRRR